MTAKTPRSSSRFRLPDSPLLRCLCAILLASLCTLLLLLLGSAAAYTQKDPAVWSLPVSLCALFLSAFLCGVLCSRCQSAPILYSGIGGTGFMLLTVLLSFLPFGDTHTPVPVVWNCVLHLTMIGCSIGGGLLGRKRKTYKKRYFKKRRF